MGLLGDTIDSVVNAGEKVVDSVIDLPRAARDTVDNVGDSISDTEDTVNDGAGDTTEDIGEAADPDTVFNLGEDGLHAAEGFLNWCAGSGEAIRGLGNWIQNNADLIPLRDDVLELNGSILKGLGGVIAGLFHSLAGGATTAAGIVAWGGSLGAWEGVGAFLAFILIGLALWMLVSSFGLQVFPSFLTGTMGVGLLLWTQNNVTGAALIALVGISLVTLGMIVDRQAWLLFGILYYIPGALLFFAALKLGFIAVALFTVAAVVALIFGLDYLERDLAPSLAYDEARGDGLIDGPKHVKNGAKKTASGSRKAGEKVKKAGGTAKKAASRVKESGA